MHRELKIRFCWRNVALAVAVVVLLEPQYFAVLPVLDTIFSFMKIAVSLVILAAFFLFHQKMSPVLFLIFLLQGVVLISTLLHQGDFYAFFLNSAYLLIFSMLVELMLDRDPTALLNILSRILTLYAVVNLLSYFWKPEGLYENIQGWPCYFLGYRNVANGTLIPAAGIAFLNSYYQKGSLSFSALLTYGCGLWFNLAVWSATGLVAFTLFGIGVLLLHQTKLWEWIKLKAITLAGILLFYGIVILRIQDYFSDFLESILSRAVTFSGRTFLWDKLLDFIRRSLLLGYGSWGNERFSLEMGMPWATHAHNQFLQILMEGGLLGFFLFVLLLFTVAFRYDKTRKNPYYAVLSVLILVFFITFQTEVYPVFYLIFAVFLISYQIQKLEVTYPVR